jgi:hypothetical protein
MYPKGAGGPLLAARSVHARAATPVSTGACVLIRPEILSIYHPDRAKHGRPPFSYAGLTGARCTPSVSTLYCYVEIWRRRDSR